MIFIQSSSYMKEIAATKWLCQYMSSCLERCKIPQIWRKATVIALPKPNKPKDDPKSYRPISLLCIPFKLFERMIHGRINHIIDPQLPHEQVGFWKGRSTVHQVTLLTQDIEYCFEAKETTGAVLVDLTATYYRPTVWHRGLALKLLRMLPDRLHCGADLKPQLCTYDQRWTAKLGAIPEAVAA